MRYRQPPCVVVGDLNIVRCLAPTRARIVLATSAANRSAFSSRYCHEVHVTPSPTRQPDAFVETLLDVGRRLEAQQPVLFFNADADLISISNHRSALSRYFRFNLASRELVRQLTDKTAFIDLAARHQLPVPRTLVLAPGDEASAALAQIRFPCIVKPAERGDWFGSEMVRRLGKPQKAMRIASLRELSALLPVLERSAGRFVIQELVEGDEANIVSYHCYADRHGRILGEYTGRKIRTYPAAYGLSSCVEVNDDEGLKGIGRDIIRRLGLNGVSKMDFKLDAVTGEIRLFEINPRYSLWNYPGARAGVNLPLLAYHDIVAAGRAPRAKFLRNVKWVDVEADFRAFLDARATGKLTFWRWLKSMRGTRVYTIWSWRDPLPFVRNLMRRMGAIVIGIFRKATRRLKRVNPDQTETIAVAVAQCAEKE